MPRRLRITEGDVTATVEVAPPDVRVIGDDRIFSVREDDGRFVVRCGANEWRGIAAVDRDVVWVEIDGQVFECRLDTGVGRNMDAGTDALTPPMSATVVRIDVQPGQAVRRGEVLIALEAMKMELPIRAPRDGVVGAVHCEVGELVQPGTRLVDLLTDRV